MKNGVDTILKNFRDVASSMKDSTKQMVVNAVKQKKLSLNNNELTLLFQIIDAGSDNAWGNAEKVLRNVINKQLELTTTQDGVSNPKK